MSTNPAPANTDVYHPEWLAFEKALGTRPTLSGNFDQDVASFDQMGKDLAKQWPELDEPPSTTDETIEPENIKVRIYRPQHDTGDLPVMVYFHGGGFISGDLYTEDPHCRIIAAKTPCVVVNVDYPLAPKVNIDHIIQSGLRSIEWTKSHNPPLSTSSTLLLAGGSAGATLALQLGYHFSSQGDTSTIAGLILIMAMTSPAAKTPYTGPFAELNTSSDDKAEGAPFLNRTAQLNMIRYSQMNHTNPNHFPLLAPSLANFPRTYIVTAEHDPSRDDGKVLAKRLAGESSNEVLEVCYVGMPHWFHWFPAVPMAAVMMDRTVQGVRWVLGLEGPGEAARGD